MGLIKKLADAISAHRHRRNSSRSFRRVVIAGHGRDTLKYYKDGAWVLIPATLMAAKIDRILINGFKYQWNDATSLSQSETDELLTDLAEHFRKKGVRWEFTDEA